MNDINQKNVILVVSDGKDLSTKDISEWLIYYSKFEELNVYVIDTSFQSIIIVNGSIDNNTDLTIGITDTNVTFNLSSIKSVFIRHARLNIINHTGVKSNSGMAKDVKSRLKNYMMAYEGSVRWFIMNLLSESNIIGYDSGGFINKLEVLKIANKVGLTIPKTILTTQKQDIINFNKENGEIIVKSIGLSLAFVDLESKMTYNQLSIALTGNDFDTIPNYFNLSMFQKRIKKSFEIRTFFLDDKCYSWALLSQENKKTTVDYRNYDWENPMRVIAFDLPKSIEIKIVTLMNQLQLRTGSIDLMYSLQDEYIFLEVNPAGQYGYNSNCSNYNLDQLIAKSLITKNETKKHRTFHS